MYLHYKYNYNEHPSAIGESSNSKFALSPKNNIYINCYSDLDLITICDLDGNLKCNVYGPGWMKGYNVNYSYYNSVYVYNDHIIAAYLGDVSFLFDEYDRPMGNMPTKMIVFDIDGGYLKTIERGRKFFHYCVDETNSRIIVYFYEGEDPVGYFNLIL